MNAVMAGASACRNALGSLRWQMLRALTPRRLVESRGLRLTLQCDNWITHLRWQSYNTKEPETLDWIDAWIRDDDVFFDIGANIGVYSLYAALRHPRLRVFAFEPEYANLHLLRDNVIQNGLKERVEVYSVALGNRSGVSRLHIQDLTPGSALHTESKEPRQVTIAQRPVIWREGIYTMTLDTFCDELRVSPNAMKLDVDGNEPNVLEGATRTLRSPCLRSLLIERPGTTASQAQCERFLSAAGLRRQCQDPSWSRDNELWVRDGG